MFSSEVKTIQYENGEIQHIQLVKFDSFEQLDFIRPEYSQLAFDRICALYADFIVPAKPAIFGQLVLFHLPEWLGENLSKSSREYGKLFKSTCAAAVAMRKGVHIIGGKPVFTDLKVRRLWHELEKLGCVRIVRGHLPNTTVIPVGDGFGFLSENEKDAKLKVNSSFFTMDRFDCATAYDELGTPIGLMVKNGTVLNPPVWNREALVAGRDGKVSVITPDLKDMTVTIRGCTYSYGSNSVFFSRPETRKTEGGRGTDIVVIGNKVAAVNKNGRTLVPASGFVIHTDIYPDVSPGDGVAYSGFEDAVFALQVGNSITVDGKKTEEFKSSFYNIRKLWSTSYPPSLYPLDFEKARAPRIALGADIEGKPMLAWVEGAGKFGYEPGKEGCGASLSEMADICSGLGMHNSINLDGGGSAQILINGKRSLRISDRNKDDFSETERAVPVGLVIR